MTPRTLSPLQRMIEDCRQGARGSKPFLLGEKTLSYSALFDRVDRTRSLFDQLALAVGSRVVIACDDDLVVTTLYLACLINGVGAVVIDPRASAAEIVVLTAKAQPKAVFIDRCRLSDAVEISQEIDARLVPVAEQGATRTVLGLLRPSSPDDNETYPACLRSLEPASDAPDAPSETTALILFTSGTTGRPKGVEITHANLAAQLDTLRRHYGLDDTCRIANPLPLHHTDGLNQGPALAVAAGATWVRPVPVTMQTLGALLDLLYRERVTHFIVVPTVLAMMTRLPAEYDDTFNTSEFRFICSTAGHLDETLWTQIEERFSAMVVNVYGLTETVCEALYCGPCAQTRKVGTIGKPVDCEARIVDQDGRELATGETGELVLRGPNIMQGYFRDYEATAAVLREGWLLTGDLAMRDEDGFYRVVGRKKNVIVRGGVNIYPEDVDTVLRTISGVGFAVTFGLLDPLLGEKVVSCIVAADSSSKPSAEAILAQLYQRLSPEKAPNELHVVDQLPLGPSGKVELAKLRTVIEKQDATRSDTAGSSTRERVIAIAATVFHEPRGMLDDSSSPETTRGWDSLAYLELVMALERQFDFKMAPRDVMSIRHLGDAIRVVETALEGNDVRSKEHA